MQVTDKAFREHRVFAELQRQSEFYGKLALSVLSFVTMGTKAACNIDTYVYSSMQGTGLSMKAILLAGHINDAYALLRKYHDSIIVNVYSNLYLLENFRIESYRVDKIDGWLQGKERLPEYRVMSQYIRRSDRLQPINDVFGADDRYRRIRDRCNGHTHYNFYRYIMLNDSEIRIAGRDLWLSQFLEDVRDLFVLNLGYIFFLNNHYMMAGDYIDALECNMQPEENSQYRVAPFIQEVFDEVVTPRRPDVTATIKANSSMLLS